MAGNPPFAGVLSSVADPRFLHHFDGAFVRTGQIKVAESEQDMQIFGEHRDLLAQHDLITKNS